MKPQLRTMCVWRAPNGQVVARVAQGVRPGPDGRPKAVYVAIAGGEQIPRERFKCATDQITRWLRANGISATSQMV